MCPTVFTYWHIPT